MTEPVDIEQWLLNKAQQFEDQQAPRNLVEGMRTAAGAITQLRDEVQTWIVHANNAIWSDSEECKMLAADNERLRAALGDLIWYAGQMELAAYDEKEWPSEHEAMKKARAALAEEKQG